MAFKSKKTKDVDSKSRNRLAVFFSIVILFFILLVIDLGDVMIFKGEKYASLAERQQTRDINIVASRGEIYDENMNPLAINEAMYTVWIRPGEVKAAEELSKSKGKKKGEKFTAEAMAETLAGIIPDTTAEDLLKTIKSDSKYTRLAKYVKEDTVNAIKEAQTDGKVKGLEITNTVRRYYPMGTLASNVIGTTNDDYVGISGLELYYDQYLTGKEGRWIKSTDVRGNDLNNGVEKYYSPQDGCSIVLTIDEVIQHFVESAVEDVYNNTDADSVMSIAMNPETGEILAMANYPDYDLNNPRVPILDKQKAELEGLESSEKVNYWNNMWRNPMINDTYEPGSPFKLLTTASALEDGLTNLSDTFVCNGGLQIYDTYLRCWKSPGSHGYETLVDGVANSCNPVFITLSQRLGISRFYNYLGLFGLTEPTGIDYPGEASPIIQNKNDAGPVGLATMSYGQGIAATPIQVMAALSSLGNDGKLMKPHLVKKLIDDEGNTVHEFKPEVVRQVVSSQTSKEICSMMENVVRRGTGADAYIPGYRIGGKTGTANQFKNGKLVENKTFSSFFAMAPMEDPKFAVLMVVNSPKGVRYGSKTAGPGVKSILSNVLDYIGIEPVYTSDEESKLASGKVTVPNLVGYSYDSAATWLSNIGLNVIECPTGSTDFNVVDQYPKPGTQVSAGNSVCLYAQ